MHVSSEFLLAGRAIFTVDLPAGHSSGRPHVTYRVTTPPDGAPNSGEIYFVSVLSGPDNEADYAYLGVLDPKTGSIRRTAKSRLAPDDFRFRLAVRVFLNILADNTQALTDAGWKLHHEGRCGRCGRLLTVPESIETGIGPECAAKLGIEMVQAPAVQRTFEEI